MHRIYNNLKSSEPKFLRNFLIKEIKKKLKNFNGNLSELHKYLKIKELNSLRYNCFKAINEKIDWEEKIFKLCGPEITKQLGSDLLIQSKINLSIQIPEDKTSLLKVHSDCWSADSPFQKNIWIPLTNAFDTNSMFILNKTKTLKHLRYLEKKKKLILPKIVKSNDFIKIKFGQYLIFNPAILHGNVVNKTNKTRISLNVRVKSIFSPEPTERNPDRKFGTYYKIWKISEDTKLANEYFKNNFL